MTFAREGDTAATLAARHLGDERRAWVIEDYNARAAFAPGQEVVIPKRDWNASGVDPNGYQIVPILVYHNLGPESKGRLVLGARAFEQQMRHLKAEGYRVISLRDFVDFMERGRQIPRRAVILTFDDGYRGFKDFAYPILKELGFTATLFVYTDYVGAGRNALTWAELQQLAKEGFEIQAHSKTHGDLRRERGEPDAQYNRRMQQELAEPQALYRRYFGRARRPPRLPVWPVGRGPPEEGEGVRVHRGLHGAPAGQRRVRVPAARTPEPGLLRDEPRGLRAEPQRLPAGELSGDRARRAAAVRPLEPSGGRAVAPGGATGLAARARRAARSRLRAPVAEPPRAAEPAAPAPPAPAAARPPSPRQALAAQHRERARQLENDGQLRRARDEWRVALTIAPDDAEAARRARAPSRRVSSAK